MTSSVAGVCAWQIAATISSRFGYQLSIENPHCSVQPSKTACFRYI